MTKALRSTRVLTPTGLAPATVLVDGERISAVRGWNDVSPVAPLGSDLIDFGDRVLLPGLVDTHVHINEPGRTDWEGFETATKAAAAGGVTTLVDMPLNCVPETTDVQALEAKRAAAKGKTWIDWAAWGGIVRGNADSVEPLARAGVPGFKCFLIHSGIDGFAWVDEADLRLALEKLRGTGLPLLAHAEVAGPVDAATAQLNEAGADWRKYSTFLASRPDAAELDAIALLVRLAKEFQTPIHIVHLSSAKALPLLAAARGRGVPVTVETCAHYLWFAAEDIPDGATEHKCAPPIRSAENREKLWQALEEGRIDMVATDHSPCPPEMKHGETGRFDEAWGGISSLGLALPVMWTAMQQRGLKLERIGEWMAAAPARLAGLAGRKGAIAPGADADLVVFDPEIEWTVTPDDLHFRHKLSPYLGAKLRGRVVETWLRGEPVFQAGKFSDRARGQEQVRR
jgi:allantoinase